jgi:hypothetical protein
MVDLESELKDTFESISKMRNLNKFSLKIVTDFNKVTAAVYCGDEIFISSGFTKSESDPITTDELKEKVLWQLIKKIMIKSLLEY